MKRATEQAPTPNILQVVQRMNPGGIETMALDLVDDAELGGGIASMSGNKSELLLGWPALAGLGDRLIALDQDRAAKTAPFLGLRRLMRELRPNAVILHHIGPLLHGGLAARAAGISNIIHVEHDAWHYRDAKHRWIAVACERLVRPKRVAVSNEIATAVRKFLPRSRPTVIPPGIDTERFQPGDKTLLRARLGIPRDGHLIGSLGRLAEVKGHRHLIAAMALMGKDMRLALAGDGPERAGLEAQAKDLGVDNRVHFLGFRSDPEAILPACDVFCLPSLAEGLPRAMLEAQACGVPVVASDVGAIGQAIAPGGRLVAVGDVQALADAITAVVVSPCRTSQAQAARAQMIENYSLAATKKALLAVVAEPS